jgi:hypothetical protein
MLGSFMPSIATTKLSHVWLAVKNVANKFLATTVS